MLTFNPCQASKNNNKKKKKKISIISILLICRLLQKVLPMFGKRQNQDTSEVASKDGPKHGEMSVRCPQCPLWHHKEVTILQVFWHPHFEKWSRQKKPDLSLVLQIYCVLERIPASFGWRWGTSRASHQFTSGPTHYNSTTPIKISLLGTFCQYIFCTVVLQHWSWGLHSL